MDARLYLRQFKAETPIEANLFQGNAVQVVEFETSAILFGSLHKLYTDRDVLFLGDPVAPKVVNTAHANIVEDAESRRMMQVFSGVAKKHHRQQSGWVQDKPGLLPTDITDTIPTDEVRRSVEANLGAQNNAMVSASTSVLHRAILGVDKMLRKKQIQDPSHPKHTDTVVKTTHASLVSGRSTVADELLTYVGELDVARYHLNGLLKGGIEILPVKGKSNAQKWISKSTDWGEAIQPALTKGVEFDTYAALYEWVLQRGLPFVPVIAPLQIESPSGTNATKNPRADILLCSLLEEKIIPVQVKFSRYEIGEYIDEMRIVTPRLLGLVDVQNHPVKGSDGRYHTGQKAVTHVGSFTNGFAKKYASGIKGHRSKDTIYEVRLEKAMQAFDALFKDDI